MICSVSLPASLSAKSDELVYRPGDSPWASVFDLAAARQYGVGHPATAALSHGVPRRDAAGVLRRCAVRVRIRISVARS